MKQVFAFLAAFIIAMAGCTNSSSTTDEAKYRDMPLTSSEARERVREMTPAEAAAVIDTGWKDPEVAAEIEPHMDSLAGKFEATASGIGDVVVVMQKELKKNNINLSLRDIFKEVDAGTTHHTASKVDFSNTMAFYVLCKEDEYLGTRPWKDGRRLPFKDRLQMIAELL